VRVKVAIDFLRVGKLSKMQSSEPLAWAAGIRVQKSLAPMRRASTPGANPSPAPADRRLGICPLNSPQWPAEPTNFGRLPPSQRPETLSLATAVKDRPIARSERHLSHRTTPNRAAPRSGL